MSYTTTSRVGRGLTGLGVKLLALVAPPAKEEPWANGDDSHNTLLDALVARALKKEKIADHLRAVDEFKNADNDVVKVEAYLDQARIFATGIDEEVAFRRLVDDANRLSVVIKIFWCGLAWIGIDITARALYRLGYFWGGKGGWSYLVAVLGCLALSSAFVFGIRREAFRGPTLLLAIGAIAGFAGYKMAYDGHSFWQAVAAVLFVIVTFYATLAISAQRQERLKGTLRAAFKQWDAKLYGSGLVPELATLVNDLMQERYSTVLSYRNEFLSRSSTGSELHQRTPVGYQIADLMNTGMNGSLAIAGPRGAGKSDLMAAFCRGSYNPDSKRNDLVVSTAAPVVYQAAEFMLDLHSELCDAVIRYVFTHDRVAARLVNKRRRRMYWLRRILPKWRMHHGWSEVLLRAYRRTDEIRYLLTIQSQVSGRLGLGRSQLSSMKMLSKAEQPMTYPQIVNRLRKDLEYFADRLATLGTKEGDYTPRLIVAVDELDRIQSADQAVAFVNEVKAIFMVRNCYFLVSVSEDALQEFELAAMGARTAIDSTFDEVLWVDYLDFNLAKTLLNNYVVGLSDQFLAFAYVRSGGLARQLIRCARELINVPKNSDTSISAVTSRQAILDLQRVSTAIKGSLTKISNHRAVAALIRVLDDYPRNSIDQTVLVNYTNRLIKCNIGDDQDARDLRDTMAAQALYLATLIRIFSSDLEQNRMEKATDSTLPGASFNALARVRRYLGINPQAALELISDFRDHWNMTNVDLTPLSETSDAPHTTGSPQNATPAARTTGTPSSA